jgi:hypothetical protein
MTKLSLNLNKYNLTKKVTKSGEGGPPSALNQASALTPSSLEYRNLKKGSSFKPCLPFTKFLHDSTSQEAFSASVLAQCFLPLLAMPQAIWLRCFRVISNKAPFTPKKAPSYSLLCGPS